VKIEQNRKLDMRIQSIQNKIPYNYNIKRKRHPAVNPLSFKADKTKSELLKSGYVPVSIQNFELKSGTDKIIIDSADKFAMFAQSPGLWSSEIILSDDIDLNGAEIKPIGNASRPFSGKFNGNGCTISNFKIVSDEDSYNTGLFGNCIYAEISNINIKNADITGSSHTGGIAGTAKNSTFDKCFFDGTIRGEKIIGGLIGSSLNNKISNSGSICSIEAVSDSSYNPFDSESEISSAGIAGGLIGSDVSSEIKGSFAKSILTGHEQMGGLIGYASNSIIQDASFSGQIFGREKTGAMIGWAEGVTIADSYSLSSLNNFFGTDINNETYHIYDSLDKLMKSDTKQWNSSFWQKTEGKMPRLKIQSGRMSAEELYLEDINNDIKTGRIKKKDYAQDIDLYKFDLHPPKHFDKNNKILEQIRNSKNAEELHGLFGEIVLEMHKKREYLKEDTSEFDEILLELVKNPYMNLNKRYEHDYNMHCTPLFILTCLNEAYVLKEALKRDDVDLNVLSGFDSNLSAFGQAVKYNIDACTYIFLKEPKVKDHIAQRMSKYETDKLSPFAKILFEIYPNIPDYDNTKGGVKIPGYAEKPASLDALKPVLFLGDAARTAAISLHYCDSNGNNIVDAALSMPADKENKALEIIIAAKETGVDFEHKRNEAEQPFAVSLERGRNHIAGYLISSVRNPYFRLKNGSNAILQFSSMPDEKYSINYMELARKRGLSINSQNNEGISPLINAVNLKHYNALKYLLSCGADPNICDNTGQTPLHKACMNNDETAVNILLNSYAYPDSADELGLKPIDYLNDELNTKFKEIIDGLAAYYETAGCGNAAIQNGVRNNTDKYIRISSLSDFDKITDLLQSSNADSAVLNLTKNIILNPNLKTDIGGKNILQYISRTASSYAKECITAAIAAGFDINERDNSGETPLIKALDAYLCSSRPEEKIILMQNIKVLLDAGADTDLTDNNGQGVLHRICQTGNPVLLKALLLHNPKVNQVDSQGLTPFDYIPADLENQMRIITNEYLSRKSVIRRNL